MQKMQAFQTNSRSLYVQLYQIGETAKQMQQNKAKTLGNWQSILPKILKPIPMTIYLAFCDFVCGEIAAGRLRGKSYLGKLTTKKCLFW